MRLEGPVPSPVGCRFQSRCVIFGPRPNNMAAPDEFITVDDRVAVAKVHLATALDVLHDDAAGAR